MKPGQATTPAERQAEAAIAQVADWQGRPLSYERINSGLTNLNWKVHLEDERCVYFMKIPGEGTELFIDRQLAYEASVKVGAMGCAPKVMHHLPGLGVEVHEFLEGFRSCNVGDLLDETIRTNIVRTYRAIHTTQVLSRNRTGFDMVRERHALVRSHGGPLPRDIDHMMWQLDRVERAVRASGMTLAACYNDSYVTNYMVDANKNVKIIDWEYASNNDPYWDLAVFAGDNFLCEPHDLRELIEIHDGRYSREAEARVFLYMGLCGLMWGLWASLQTCVSSLPFDYAKYSDLLMFRARQVMRQPRWEEALLLL